jgi:hypothetical protein
METESDESQQKGDYKNEALNMDDASFRDPSGNVLHYKNEIYRIINNNYKNEFEHFIKSGLYEKLISENLLVQYKENSAIQIKSEFDNFYKIIKQEKIHFISYPYEWSFDMLKDAALTILQIQKICLEFGMSLKDASAYNIQFYNGKPILIDTTSFEMYQNGPWKAYRQFCEHFLAPLALMSKKDVRLFQLLLSNIDGIPLDIAAEIVPKSTFTNFGLAAHLHAHAKAQKHYENKKIKKQKLGKTQLLGIVENLKATIKNLKIKQKTEWADYYNDTNYSDVAEKEKRVIVKNFLKKCSSEIVIDLGANDGRFSEIAAENSYVVSMDIDPIAVNTNYLKHNPKIIPIVTNFANPSPAIGWSNNERKSLFQRIKNNTCMALALIHHLRITHGIPLKNQFEVFSKISKFLIIEFVPKEDSQVKRLLQNRDDVFDDYDMKTFEHIAFKNFENIESLEVKDSLRKIYLMKNKLM